MVAKEIIRPIEQIPRSAKRSIGIQDPGRGTIHLMYGLLSISNDSYNPFVRSNVNANILKTIGLENLLCIKELSIACGTYTTARRADDRALAQCYLKV